VYDTHKIAPTEINILLCWWDPNGDLCLVCSLDLPISQKKNISSVESDAVLQSRREKQSYGIYSRVDNLSKNDSSVGIHSQFFFLLNRI
jgi:hypothetical protein